jgi:hypothetical protein
MIGDSVFFLDRPNHVVVKNRVTDMNHLLDMTQDIENADYRGPILSQDLLIVTVQTFSFK